MSDVMVTRLDESREATDFLTLFTEYTRSLGTAGIPSDVPIPTNLVEEIRKRSDVVVFLAYEEKQPAGFAVTIESFSTFRAMPSFNIHDIGVSSRFRRQGVGKDLLTAVRDEAKKRGCCKVTLEVYENNTRAYNLYRSMGFSALSGNDDSEQTLFMASPL
ncbi:GNAT family N-acetyltransferase [Desulfoluna spongiiphila]|uniref:Acetyltransferase (GNAT) family protein n=1 Tax=Desulfoluna spongiiphila TaxID=419481 RepID=A0A1G5ENV8_9BACT|nr:GNAT family N-acetyltransferase [Desulfoluna spongiiphila]SCY28380.1 Acetyltransferase (GNAT) family protein [Desulfoluna spongiiphila]VVS91226.1 acyl-coa n-acyltransferase [Desulfoluna spongiiphila]